MFFKEVIRVSKIIKPILAEKKVRIFSHYDTDGLSSAAILIKMLVRAGAYFELRILKQLTSRTVKDVNTRSDEFIIFSDLGSGQLNALKETGVLDETQILVLDHHEPVDFEHPNLFHLNPLVFGEEEVSSSVICYLLAKNFDAVNSDSIDLAILGAVGDMQDEKWEFRGEMRKVLGEAENLGKVSITRGLRLYGRNNRPIHKSLEYSFDPIIPNITGSESHAAQFLSDLDIPLQESGEWRRLSDLTEEEEKRLVTAIIVERLKYIHKEAADVFGEIYTFLGWPEDLQDSREFATLVNACGRFDKAVVGIRLCLGDLTAIKDSWSVMDEYRKKISDAINWLRDGNGTERMDKAIYIFGGNRIPESIIGTITSIALNSNVIEGAGDEKPLIGFADSDEGYVKISARAQRNLSLNLRNIISDAARAVGGEGGGHQFAAGGLIRKEKQKEFINKIEGILSEYGSG